MGVTEQKKQELEATGAITAWSKLSVNGITIDPGPVLGEPIP
jgi:hypothetical protein